MKTTALTTALTSLVLAGVAFTTGCGPDARTPEGYRDDTQKVLDTKSNDIKACYDAILKSQPGVGGKVTVKFEIAVETGKLQNVTVDQPNTTAPPNVSACVQQALTGLAVAPPDANLGQAAFVYEFSQPPAPPAPPAPGKT